MFPLKRLVGPFISIGPALNKKERGVKTEEEELRCVTDGHRSSVGHRTIINAVDCMRGHIYSRMLLN